jgi:hypothetical protein
MATAGNLTAYGAKRLAENNANTNVSADSRRARLRPKPAAMTAIIGNSPILAPLKSTNGMVWPYQPNIGYAQELSYQDISMTHTNQEFYAYTRTNAVKLTCEGEFTAQNQTEGLYTLACLHFLRTVTKMYFGQGDNLGTPPPVLFFDAFGPYMFNQLPVIVTGFTANMPKDVDYMPIDLANLGSSIDPNVLTSLTQMASSQGGAGTVWLPALFSISVNLTVQNTPAKLRTFNLDEFRSGSLLKGGGWI